MSTIKISQLPLLTTLNANTQNTLFVAVDLSTTTTGKFTGKTLAAGLFSNEILNVGGNPVVYPNVLGQFSSSSNTYLQINLQNFNSNGSSDFVASTSDSDNSVKYIDFGISGNTYNDPINYSAFKAYDGYMYVYGPSNTSQQGNLIIGTASTRANIVFLVGGLMSENIVGRVSNSSFDFLRTVHVTGNVRTSTGYVFSDGTQQITAGASVLSLNTANTFLQANDLITITAAKAYTDTANTFLQANDLITITAAKAYTDTANTFLQANDTTTLTAARSYTDTANTFLKANDLTTLTSARSYTDTANTYAQTTLLAKTGGTITGSLVVTGNITANAVGTSISVDNFTSNSATFSRNVIILGNLTANTLQGNVFFSNITTGTSQSNSIQWFALSTSPVQTSGQVWYSSNTISLVQDTDVAGDRPAISKVLFERVYNGTGSIIAANSWVRLAGAVTSNSVPYITLADATSAANSIVEGFVKVGIPSGGYGFLYTKGIVDDLDASSFGNNGQILFLSTTPGRATNVAPTGANSVFQVAKILSNGSANGKIQIDIAARQAYGKPNGAILFANNNLIQASNVAIIDEANSTIYVPNGLLFNTRSYAGNQTAITLNFATDTWVRCNVNANMAVTLSNFRSGSDINLFVINISGVSRTITHGCSALNSTTGTTTFALDNDTTARIKYFSFDGDLANTYCSVSYS
jgi:hypothetical protein